MLKSTLGRVVAAGASAIMASVGFTITAAAASASIDTTGPGSYNRISYDSDTACRVNNDNNINIRNNNPQNARTGNVSARYNTSVGGGWSNWDPSAWQAQGYSYEQWYSQFMGYMSSQQSAWSSGWSGNSGHGGGLSSGNASNNSHNVFNVMAHNDNNSCNGHVGSHVGGGASISTTGPGSRNVISADADHYTRVNNDNQVGIYNNNPQHARTGSVNAYGNTSVGGHGGGSGSGDADNYSANHAVVHTSNSGGAGGSGSHTGHSSSGGHGGSGSASIHLTGPNSRNAISSDVNTRYTETNSNSVHISNSNAQTARSGNVSASHNTLVGALSSGNASNSSSNDFWVDLSN
jgi:hypothetical protein